MPYPVIPLVPALNTTRSGTLQSASAADGHGTALAVNGSMASVVFTVVITGTGSCTITFKASSDGTNYDNLLATLQGTTTTAATVSYSGTSLTHLYTATIASMAQIQAWQSSTSGTVSVTITAVASTATNEQLVVGTIATVVTNADTTIGGTTAPTDSFSVGGVTNDTTPQYQLIPLGAGGRSAIVEHWGPYPNGATPITAAANGTTGAVVATLAKATGKTTYITGFEITGSGATSALVVQPTVVGVITGTLTYTYAAIAGATLINTPLIVQFSVPIPSSTTNTDIVVTCPALGSGCTSNTVVAHGYRL